MNRMTREEQDAAIVANLKETIGDARECVKTFAVTEKQRSEWTRYIASLEKAIAQAERQKPAR